MIGPTDPTRSGGGAPVPGQPEPAHAATTLLIVDDHAGFRSSARALLEAQGFTVVGEAEDGASAQAVAAHLRPQVVMLDIVLPDIDGFAVCELLAVGDDDPAVVLTSSRSVSSYRRRLVHSPALGLIAKADLSGAALMAITS